MKFGFCNEIGNIKNIIQSTAHLLTALAIYYLKRVVIYRNKLLQS